MTDEETASLAEVKSKLDELLTLLRPIVPVLERAARSPLVRRTLGL